MKKILFFALLCCFTTELACGMQVKENSIVDPLCDDVWFAVFEFVGRANWHFRVGMLICKKLKKLSEKFLRQSIRQPLTLTFDESLFAQKNACEFSKQLSSLARFLTDDMRILLFCYGGNDTTDQQLSTMIELFEHNLEGMALGCPPKGSKLKEYINLAQTAFKKKIEFEKRINIYQKVIDEENRMVVKSATIEGLKLLKKCGKKLKNLVLIRFRNVTNKNLCELVSQLEGLRYLQIRYCSRITKEIVEEIRTLNKNVKVVYKSPMKGF